MIVRLLGWGVLALVAIGVGSVLYPDLQNQLPAAVKIPAESIKLDFYEKLKESQVPVGPERALDPAPEVYQYRLRLGSFKQPERTERLRAMLLLEEGMKLDISRTDNGFWLVQTGLLASRQQAEQLRERLLSRDIEAVLVAESKN